MSDAVRADALLAEMPRDGRGRLKVFLGAAPGVGKTFAMLQAAQAQLRQGVDLRAGVVETHGRAETEALLVGVPQQPQRSLMYRDVAMTEMDLDGILAKPPKLLLVDELAHSNAPGSRHAKRWQDIQELLAAGIDVFTTVNVQHLESLNDHVRGITGVQVRETLPDWVLQEAFELVLIDLPHSRQYFLSLLAHAGVRPQVVMESGSLEMVRALVAHGHGLSLLTTRPSRDVSYDGRRLVCKPLSGKVPPQRLVLAVSASVPLSPAAEAFVQVAREHLAAAG